MVASSVYVLDDGSRETVPDAFFPMWEAGMRAQGRGFQLLDMLDLSEHSEEELSRLLCEAGSFRHLMHASQQACYDKYRAWAERDQTGDTDFADGSLPRMFALPVSKRWGKTSLCLWIKTEDCIRQPGSKHRYTSAFDNSIKSIITDVQRHVFSTLPDSIRPTYHTSRAGRPAGFYFPTQGPAEGSVLYLKGLESNPDALRGQECDGDVISEAGFIDGLLYAIRNVIYQQYQGARHKRARLIIESSAPVKLGTDWERVLLPDAIARDAYFTATIRDNPMLSDRDVAEFEAAAGGKHSIECQREYYNVIAVDPESSVFPEFDAKVHVRPHTLPPHAYTITAADPGMRDLFGLTFGFYDFLAGKLVIQASWAKQNASSLKVACVIAAHEFALWGTWPHPRMARIPLHGTADVRGWTDMLAGEPFVQHASALHDLAQMPLEGRPWAQVYKTQRESPAGWFTAWDGSRFVPGPQFRVSDIEHRLMMDLAADYGIQFQATDKEGLEAMSNLVRTWLGNGKLVFLPTAGPVIEHMRAARWNRLRTAWDRPDAGKVGSNHSGLGHFDLAAAATYQLRKVNQSVSQLNPMPPDRLKLGYDGNVLENYPGSTAQTAHGGLQQLLGGDTKFKSSGRSFRTR